jgi:serine phosphatase RsbU (regulator of sigma subunit)
MMIPLLTVRQVMQPDPVVVPSGATVQDTLDLMNRLRIGAVVVVGPDASLAGIFTERDLLRRVATADPGWRELPVSDWMTRNPHTIGPDADWDDATALMDRLRVRHLPVIEGGKVIGIVSTRHLLSKRTEYLNRQVEERTRELRQAHDELLARDTDLRYNLKAAGRLQTRLLLPNAPPEWPELRWAVHYAPLDHLGGDYYDIAHPTPDHLGFLIADASGHSIAAAMVAIMSRIAFSEAAPRTTSPGAVLTEMNRRLQGLADERFVTAFYAVLDRRSGELTFANAGHPYPLRYTTGGGVEPLAARGFMLGIMPDEEYRETTVRLASGDRLCFYTDGLVESRNEIGEAFGTDRLVECFRAHGAGRGGQVLEHVLACQRGFAGGYPVSDDLTVVVGEYGTEGVR